MQTGYWAFTEIQVTQPFTHTVSEKLESYKLPNTQFGEH